MRRVVLGSLFLLLPALAGAPRAELLSKSYQFKDGVVLELGVETPTGLRLDYVRFQLPAMSGDRQLRASGGTHVEVAISNTGDGSRMIGLAIALFDAEGRLVGVASGGTALVPLKPGRQRPFTLAFSGVNGEAHKAATFQISVESKP